MPASNAPQRPTPATFAALPPDLAPAVAGLWNGSLGHTVRCVPTRRVVAAETGAGWLFGKWRVGARADAAAEWRWLHLLPLLGLRTPAPVAWLREGRRSLLVTRGVSGRPLDAWMVTAAREGFAEPLLDYLCRRVAPLLRCLHGQRLAYRDLYWNHVFADDPRGDPAPVFLDVERVFRPRWRWRRWLTKDLAGLRASVPAAVVVTERQMLRFARACLGPGLRAHRALLAAVVRKARRIRRHEPRFG
ncbi:MAG: hypothetical protein FJ265_10355 [Planctomycetes bacterium]|nr:hypothetical protein [Planctomycetota bacterium]